MTYSIKDNEDLNLYQYSSNKYLALSDYGSATAVQFVKGKDTVLITDIASDGTAPIPNQFLNGSYQGMVQFYLLDSNSTKIDGGGGYFTVKKNSFPEGYKFNGTECKTYKVNMLDSSVIDGNTLIVTEELNGSYLYPYIKTIDLSKASISNTLKSMNQMFRGYSNVPSIDLSSFNTQNITDMGELFYNCRALTNITFGDSGTPNVLNMGYMFGWCSSLTSINWGYFNTESATNMSGMFACCESLSSLDLSFFNTSNVTYMNNMFQQCNNLENLIVHSFDTRKVTDMYAMFHGKFTELDLSSFNTENVTDMREMLGCHYLKSLTLGQDWGVNTSITSFNLNYCPLTHDSCLDVFNKLADKTQTATTSATLTLKSTTKALMSDTEIAIATNKGWTVS